MKDELLTIQQAAELLGVSTKTLRRWEVKGHLIPQRTIGNQRRYSKTELTTLFQKEKGNIKVTPKASGIPQDTKLQTPAEQSASLSPVVSNLSSPVFVPVQIQSEEKSWFSFRRAELSGAIVGIVLFLGVTFLLLGSRQLGEAVNSATALLTSPEHKSSDQIKMQDVLAAKTQTPAFQLRVNIPGFFGQKVTFLTNVAIKKALSVAGLAQLTGGINTNNASINAGKGTLTASNVIYSVRAGSNISIGGDKQNPTISVATPVSSVQGTTGAIAFTGGTGISLNGLQINNTGVTSLQGQTGDISLTAGSGIAVSGTTISNTDAGSAQNIFKTITAGGTDITAESNSDQITFAAGSGISITGDANSKEITITNSSSPNSLASNGILYATGSDTFTSLSPGASGFVLQANGPNSPPSWVANSSTSPPFNMITSGTNTQASMVVGTGASLDFTGTGTINASSLNGQTFANPGSIGSGTAGSGVFTTLSGSDLLSANGGLTVASGQAFKLAGLTVNGGVLYTDGTGTVTQTALGSDGNVLTLIGGVPTWQTSAATNYWQFNAGVVSPASITNDLAIGGTATSSALFEISGTTGNATTSGIFTFGGTTAQVQSQNGRTLTIGGANTGNVIINSAGNVALTAQGANLTTGGDLNVIGNLSTSGGTGLSASGNGAGLTFSGLNNHIISASSGTLELGAVTLNGDITGNGKNLTGLNNLSAGGTITFSGIGGTGIVHSDVNGQLSSSAVNLGSSDVTGTLGATNGGTGQASYAVGDILYADTTTSLARRAIGGNGQILTVQGGVPVWSNAGGTINFWQENLGAVSPLNITDDLLLGATATGSAKIAFENVAGGTPTASISASSGNNATYLTGDGTLATTNKQTLTLGSTSTGNIDLFGFGSGVVHTNASGALSTGLVQNNELQNSSITITTSTGLSGGGSVALGNSLTLTNTGLTSAAAGAGISLSGGTGDVTITNTGVTSLAGTPDQVSVTNGGTGAVTLSLPQNIDSGATPTFSSLTLSADTNELKLGTTHVGTITLGSLSGPQTYTLPDASGTICLSTGNCAGSGTGVTHTGTGVSGQIAYFDGSNDITSSSNFLFTNDLEVTGANGSKAAAIFNQQNAGDILTASSSGTTKFTIANDGTLTDVEYNGTNGVLYANTSGVISQSNDAGSSGQVLLSNSGTPTFTGLSGDIASITGAGVVTLKSVGPGAGSLGTTAAQTPVITVDAQGRIVSVANTTIAIDASQITSGQVATANGGLGANLTLTKGDLIYANSSSAFTNLAIGSDGTCLVANGGVPTWGNCGNGGTNYWQLNAGALSPLTVSNDLLLGSNATTSAKFAFVNNGSGTPVASISANSGNNATYLTGDGSLATTNKQTLTLGSSSTGNLDLFGFGSGVLHTNASGILSTSAVSLTGDVSGILPVANGGTGADLTLSSKNADGSIPYFSGGVMTTLAIGGDGSCLVASGGVPTWGSCAGGTSNFWQLVSGALSPLDSHNDLLLGGSATSSAKFAFVNNGNGTPVASISANSGNNATYLTGNGTLGTTNDQTLTLGSTSTGNVALFGFGEGALQTNASGVVSSGTLSVANGGTGVGTFGGTNTLLYTTGTDTLSSIGTANNAALITNGSGAPSFTSASPNQVLRADNSGTVGFGAIDISQSAAVTGVLATANGGLGADLTLTSGDLIYANSSTSFTNLAIGSGGTCLTSDGSKPVWGSCAGGVQNYWQLNAGALSPLNMTNDVLFGATSTSSAKFAFVNNGSGTPVASISANTPNNSLYLTGDGTLATTNKQTLTLGSASTGNIVLSGFGAGAVQTNASGVISSGILSVANGGTGANSLADLIALGTDTTGNYVATITGNSQITVTGSGSENAGVILAIAPDSIGDSQLAFDTGQNLTTTSAPTFANLIDSGLSNNSAVYTDGSNQLTTTAPATGVIGYLQRNAGALAPSNLTDDLLLGAISTTSAKFAFTNVAGGTPTASISGSAANNALYVTGDGTLATANKESLILGSASTGNLDLFGFGAGVVRTNASGVLSSGLVDLTSDVTGILPITNGGSPFSQANGAIFERNTTQDFLLGGTSSTSAEFAVTGINTNIPVASLSGSTGGTYLSAAGVLATTNKLSLTLGDNNTGNIVLPAFTGNNAVLYAAPGTGVLSSTVTSTDGLCLLSSSSTHQPAWGACPGSGSGSSKWTLTNDDLVIYPNSVNQQVGIGTTTESDVASSLYVTRNLASGALGKALAIFNQTENQDLLTASASGATRFVVSNNGSLEFTGGSSQLQTITSTATHTQTINIPDFGGGSSDICLVAAGNCAGTGSGVTQNGTNANGQVAYFTSGNNITSSSNFLFTNDLEVTGANGGKAATIVNQLNSGDIFTASASGNTKFTIANDGTLTDVKYTTGIAHFDSNGVLSSSAVNLASGDVTGILPITNGGSPFSQANGAIFQRNITQDFLVGGTSSSSAAFAVINVNPGSGTPTASVSGANNNATSLTATGTLATTNNQSLTLGNSSTGNIILAPLNGAAGAYVAPSINNQVDLGTSSLAFRNVYAGTVNAASDVKVNGVSVCLSNGNNCPAGAATYWQLNNGALAPVNITNDVLLGSTATTSAKFAFVNVAGGVPTASVSANSGNNATYLTGNGTLGTTNGQSLTLGSTGNINFFNTNNVLTSTGNLTLNGTALAAPNLTTLTTASGLSLGSTTTLTLGVSPTINPTSGTLALGGANTSALSLGNGTNDTTLTLNGNGLTTLGGNLTVNGTTVTLGGSNPTITTNSNNGLTLTSAGNGQTLLSSDFDSGVAIGSANSTPSPLAINGGIGNNGALIVNQLNSGDIFDASQAGNLKFSVQNNGAVTLANYTSCGSLTTTGGGVLTCSGEPQGTNFWQINNNALSPANSTLDVLFGGTATTSARFAFINNAGATTPVASISANSGNNATYLTGDGSLATTNKQTLTLGSSSTGNLDLFGFGSGVLHTNASGILSTSAVSLTGDVSGILPVANGGTGADLTLSSKNADGSIPYFSGGVMTTLAIGGDGSCLVASGGAPTWSSCSGVGTNFWQVNGGALSPLTVSNDLLLGSTATTSAKFAFTGNAGSLTPVASISAITGPAPNGLTLSPGSIQSLNLNTLTIGGSSTGNIVIDSGSNVTQLADNTIQFTGTSPTISSTGTLTINAFTLGGTISAAGKTITNVGTLDLGSSNLSLSGNTISSGSTLTLSGATGLSDTGLTTLTSASTFGISATTLNIGNGAGAALATTSNGNLTLTAAGSGQTLLSSDFDSGVAIGTANSTPSPLAINGGIGNNAALIVNNTNNGDLIDASASGTTKFEINNNGDLAFTGGSSLLQTLTSNATHAQTYNLIDFGGGSADICLSTGNCAGTGSGVTQNGTNANGQVAYFTSGNNITSSSNFLFTNDLEVTGANGGKAATIVNQLNSGDIFTASASGNTKFTIANDGTLTDVKYTTGIAQFNSNGVLSSSAINLGTIGSNYITGVLPVANGGSPFDQSAGAIFERIGTQDLLLGSNATTSAKFAFINVNANTPTASISANNGNNATFLTGNGTLGTTNGQSLTLGTTGNINFFSSANVLDTLGNLSLAGNGTFAGATGLTLSGNGASLAFTGNSGDQITTAAGQNLTITPGGSGNTILTSTYQSGVKIGGAGNTIAPLSVSGGIGNNGAFIVNQTNSGDIIDASAAGSLQFAVQNNGNVVIGNGAILKASSGNILIRNLADSAYSQLYASSVNSYGNSYINTNGAAGNGVTNGYNNQTGSLLIAGGNNNGTLDGAQIQLFGPQHATNPYLALITADTKINSSGTTGNAALIVNQVSSGVDIFTASASGVTRFTITNTGNLVLAGGQSSLSTLTLATGAPGTITFPTAGGNNTVCYQNDPNCGFSVGANVWQLNSNAISPTNSTYDVLIGGTATGSAKFGFLNNAGGTPVASISANSGNNATYLTGAGVLGTTNAQTLTLGSTSTGNINLNLSNNSQLTVNGTNIGQTATNVSCINVTNGIVTSTTGICPGSTNLWQLNNNALSPVNSVYDVLFGGTSTSSAKFAFINNAGGTPTASIAGNLSLQVPTGANPTENLNVLNGGVFNLRMSPGGDAGLTSALTVLNNGFVGINNTNPQYPLEVGGKIEIDSGDNGYFYNADSGNQVKALFNGPGEWLALESDNTDIYSFAAKNAATGTDGTPILSMVLNSTGTGGFVGIGTSNTGNAELTVNQPNAGGDIFSASKSGTTKFTIQNDGTLVDAKYATNLGVLYVNSSGAIAQSDTGSSGNVLSIVSGVPTWTSAGAAGITSWQENAGALSPFNITDDLLLGGNATTSARFAFINNAGATTPVASISANSGNNATYLTGNGTLGTTNGQSLTLGSTGNINFFNTNNVLTSTGNLTLNGTALAAPNLTTLTTASGLSLGSTTTLTLGVSPTINPTSGTLALGGANTSALSLGNGTNNTTLTLNGNGLTTLGGNLTVNGTTEIVGNGSDYTIESKTGNNAALNLLSQGSSNITLGQNAGNGTVVVQPNAGGQASLIVKNQGAGDLFTASAGATTKFTVDKNGNLIFAGGQTNANSTISSLATSAQNYQLPANGGTFCLSTNNCGFATGTNYWQSLTTGAIEPFNTTYDLLLGGSATTSARFAFINNTGATTVPTASISANNGNNATYLTGAGVLGTTNAQTLTLGAAGTGNIVLAPNGTTALTAAGANVTVAGAFTVSSGTVSFNGFNGVLQATSGTVTASALSLAGANVTGILPVANGGSPFNQNLGSIFENITTQDLLLGGTSTASAKFAFLNNAGGTPTASISAISNNNALYLDGNGNIGTTNRESLTFGNTGSLNTTGNILFNTNSVGAIGIGTVNPDAPLTLAQVVPDVSNGTAFDLTSAMTSTTNTQYGARFVPVVNPASTNNITYIGFYGAPQSSSTHVSTDTLEGFQANPYWQGGGSSTLATMIGGYLKETAAANLETINNAYGLWVQGALQGNSCTTCTFTNNAGVAIDSLTVGTNNTSLLIGTTTIPTGNYGIYNTATYQNYLNGGLSIGSTALGNGEFVVNQPNAGGDILSASQAATTKFTINNSGNIIFAGGQTNANSTISSLATSAQNYQLPANGGTFCLSTNNCGFATGTNYWQSLTTGAIEPFNTTYDLLLGGSATTSARFAFINNTGATTVPTASISANNGNNATYLTGNGTLGTTNGQSLTLGSTGNINFFNTNNVLSTAGNLTLAGTTGITLSGNAAGLTFTGTGTDVLSTANNSNLELSASGTGRIGINTNVPFATLDVRANTGSTPVASISGNTAFANLIVDQSGTGDIFTASKSGATEFTITNAGNVVIGGGTLQDGFTNGLEVGASSGSTATPQTIFLQDYQNAGGQAQIAGNWNNATGWGIGTATSTAGDQTLRLAATQNANGTWNSFEPDLKLMINGPVNTPAAAILDVRSSGTNVAIASVSGQSTFANLVVDQSGSGDLFTASNDGATKFTILNNGNISLNNYTNCGSLTTTGGGVLTCSGVPQGTNYWQVNTNALSPGNSTDDLLLGGNATTSARFAFINNAGATTPVASISANSGNNATYLTGNGTLGTTNGQSLTLGSTGNINFFNTNNVLTSTGNLTLNGTALAAPNLTTLTTASGLSLGSTTTLTLGVSPTINPTSGTLALGGANTSALSLGNGTNNTTLTLNGNGLTTLGGNLTVNGTTEIVGNGSDYTIESKTGNNAALNLLSQGSSNITLGQNAGNGTVVVQPNAGGQASLIVKNQGAGDLFTASAGATTKFTVDKNGNLIFAGGQTNANSTISSLATSAQNYQLPANGGTFCLSTNNCGFATGTNYWQSLTTGAIEPFNTTYDLLLGGSATTSARFAFINNAGATTPVASISANSGNNATYLTGNGTLGTTNGQSLTLGSTGNINFFNTNNVLTSTGNLTLNGTALAAPNLTTLTTASGLSLGSTTTLTLGVSPTINPTSGTLALGGANTSALSLGNGTNNTTLTLNGNGLTTLGGNLTVNGTTEIVGNGSDYTIESKTGNNAALNLLSQGSSNITLGQNAGNGTVVVQPNAGGQASLIVKNQGAGDLFTASAGATTKFTVDKNGNLIFAGGQTNANSTISSLATSAQNYQLPANGGTFCLSTNNCGFATGTNYWQSLTTGAIEPFNTTYDLLLGGSATTSARFAFINNAGATTPVASISANSGNNATYLTGNGTLGTTNGQSLTLGSTGNINFFNTNNVLTSTGNLTLNGTALAAPNLTTLTTASGLSLGSTTTLTLGVSPTINPTSGTLALGGANTSALSLGNGTNNTTLTLNGNGLTTLGGNLTVNGTTEIVGNGSDYTIESKTGNNAALNLLSQGSSNITLGQNAGNGTVVVQPNAGGQASLIVKNQGAGDLFTASAGATTKFTVDKNGNLIFAGGQTNANSTISSLATSAQNYQLPANGGTFCLSTNNCGFATGTNYWQSLTTGAIEPFNTTYDLLLGGSATTSARFAFINNTGATTVPTASISANNGNNATYLTGAGVLGTTNAQTLTLGAAGTGNIVLAPNGTTALTAAGANVTVAGAFTVSSGTVSFNGFNGVLQATSGTVTASALSLAGANVTGILPVANGGSPFNQNLGSIFENITTQDLLLGGTSTASAKFAFLNNAGGTPTASISGNLSLEVPTGANPGATFNILNGGTLSFANSAGGDAGLSGSTTPDLYIGSNGEVAIGSNAPIAKLYVAGTFRTSSTSTNAVEIQNGANHVLLNADTTDGLIGIGGLGNLFGSTPELAVLDVRATSGSTPVASISGNTAFANLVVDQSGSGDLFTASNDGATKFTILNNGNISLNNYTNCGSLTTTGGGVLTCSGVPQGTNYWQVNTNALSPGNSTDDLLLGGNATTSARFAFINNAGATTPVASISANSGNNATYLTGNGTLGTTNGQSLTLGSTGNINFFNTNNVLTSTGNLTLNGTALAAPNLTTLTTASGLSLGSTTTLTLGVSPTINPTSGTLALGGANTSALSLGNGTNNTTLTLNGNGLTTLGGNLTVNGTTEIVGNGSDYTIESKTGNNAALNLLSQGSSNITLGQNAGNGTVVVQPNAGGQASLIVKNQGAGDLFTASAGATTKFTVDKNGNLIFAGGQTNANSTISSLATSAQNYQLPANGGTFCLSTNNCGFATGTNYWQSLTTGAIEPFNTTYDLLLGGSATTSARFAFINNTGATTVPTASISANNGNNATYLTGAGVLGTTNAQTLTLGAAGTGNIVLAPNGTTALTAAGANVTVAGAFTVSSGTVSFNGFNGVLQATSGTVTASALSLAGANVTGILPVANGGSPFNQNLGSIFENITTQDLLLGGTSTASAKFAFLNNAGGTPTASISGNLSLEVPTGANPGATFNILNGGSLGFYNSAGGDAGLSGTPDLYIGSNGEVAIGSNAPIAKLYVAGTFRTSSNSTNAVEIQNGVNKVLFNADTTDGMIGIGGPTNYFGFNPELATLDVRATSATTAVASVSGASNFANLVVDQEGSGDIFTASESGATKFTVQNSGTVVIGNNTNGIQFDPTFSTDCNGGSTAAVYCGSARPTKQIVLSAEYAGAVLTASGSATTNGFMTSDASPSASSGTYNFENYYQWVSMQNSLQDYTVAVRVTLPKDFSAWAGNAMTVDYNTNIKDPTSNKLDVTVYNPTFSASIPVLYDQANFSATDNTWQTDTYVSSRLANWTTAGQTAVIYLHMYSKNGLFTQVGDIKLNYLSAF